jgi:hypothetical protein
MSSCCGSKRVTQNMPNLRELFAKLGKAADGVSRFILSALLLLLFSTFVLGFVGGLMVGYKIGTNTPVQTK